jgi:hypothetical protein
MLQQPPPQYDPYQTAGRLAHLGLEPDILAQAMVELGYAQ